MNPPCKDCPNRHPGCHGSCEKYQIWRKEWEQLKERERQRKGVYRPPKNPDFVVHRIKGYQ